MKSTVKKIQPRKCTTCGEEIPAARIRILPNTTICVDCAQARENKGQFQRHVIDVQPEIESWENVSITQTLIRGTQV